MYSGTIMVSLDFKQNLLDDNFFCRFQELSLIINTLHFFEELNDVFDQHLDGFIVDFDETVDKHILLHQSKEFKETRPVCYLDQKNFKMKEYHSFIIQCIRYAWIEHLI